MITNRTAVVVGAGPAGLATAVALRRAGFDARVYERRPRLSSEGTGLTLWPNGLNALACFDADGPVRERARTAPGTAIRAAGGRPLQEMSAADLERAGGCGVALHRAELVTALAGELDPGVVRFGMTCTGVTTDERGAVTEWDNGEHIRADLVVGADGLRSRVRAAAGLDRPLRPGGSTVWRAVVEHPLPPLPGLLTLGGPHQFGVWRLPGDQVYWFASAPARPGHHRSGVTRPPTEFSSWHAPIGALLDATPTERIVATDVYDCAPLPAWHRGRIVLVGDAAHPSLPHMGQGTSQAFEDAAVLADRLASVDDVETALRQYHQRRRSRARAAWSQARMLARVGGWHGSLACGIRERMLASAPAGVQVRQLQRLFAFRT